MHSLAISLSGNGHQVTGSADAIFDPSLSQLQKAGICPVQIGWFPEKINASLDAVVMGMHAKKDNPELLDIWIAPEVDHNILTVTSF